MVKSPFAFGSEVELVLIVSNLRLYAGIAK